MALGRVFTFYSASGGVGKTVTALHAAKYLHSRHQNVIYMSLDSSPVPLHKTSDQSRRYWPRFFFEITSEDFVMDRDHPGFRELADTFIVRDEARLGGLPVLLPEEKALLHWHDCIRDLSAEDVGRLLAFARQQYDYIVMDVDAQLTPPTVAALTESNQIYWLLAPDYATLSKAVTVFYAQFLHDKAPLPGLKESIDAIRFVFNRSVFFDGRVSAEDREVWKKAYIDLFTRTIPERIAADARQTELSVHTFLPYVNRWKDVESFDEWFQAKDYQFMIDEFSKHVAQMLEDREHQVQ